jgi:predicted hotdog family 3-hydroxylacyl-ACP dehydratase
MTRMLFERDWILAHIPHQGSMCLLDRVLDFDEHAVRCSASSHRDAANPLRAHGRLAAVCAIEYAAQAMAVHGALLARGADKPAPGYLASVRNVRLYRKRLDDIETDLEIEAMRIGGDAGTILYGFTVKAGGLALAEGRAAVFLNAAAAA